MGLIENIKEYQHNFAGNSNREKAYLSFLNKGFPNTKNEEWKFSSLKKIISHDFTIEDMKFAYGAMKDSEVELTPFELECMAGGKGEKALAASGEVAAELGNDMLADMF